MFFVVVLALFFFLAHFFKSYVYFFPLHSNIIAAKVGITQTNFDALWCLVVMSAVCTSIPIFFVWLLPSAIENTEQVDLTTKKGKSKWGGMGAVFLVLGGLCYATVHSIVKVSTDNS